MIKLTPTIFLLILTINNSFSQNELKLENGYYETFDDFISKKASKEILSPLKIKNRLGSDCFSIKDKNDHKLNNYFAIVQNDSILLRSSDVEKRLNGNKKVIFYNKKTDYFLSIGNNENEIYFRQFNNSKSLKYIGIGIATPTSMIFNFDTSKFIVFFKKTKLIEYLTDNKRPDLIKSLSEKKKLKHKEVTQIMEEYFEIKKTLIIN